MIEFNPGIFREYDIRGVADRDLTDDHCDLLGRAIGTTIRRAGGRRITLGRDCRLHSDRIHDALLAGLLTTGLEVSDVGVCATPLLYYSVQRWRMDGGVMITASHNPSPDNGLKVCVGPGTIHGEAVRRLRELAVAGDFVAEAGGRVEPRPVLGEYVDEVASGLRPGRRLRLAVDAGNGPGGIPAVAIFRRLGHEIHELYCEPDGRFPNHHPDPTVPSNLRDLAALVREKRLDVGIAYDGDADRLGVVDERGEILWGDRLMILFARSILHERTGTFIADVKCSRTLFEDVPKHGGRIVMWKTGHSLIKEKMRQEQALLAGEMSGHLFFADRWYGFDDAIYASARLLEILARSEAPLSTLLADVPTTVATPEIRVPCAEPRKAAVVAAVAREFGSRHDTIDLDGVRISFAEGWGLVRASNTEPVLVLRFEASDETALGAIRSELETFVRARC